MEKFLGKYRIPSARASWWDYAAPGDYFITICTAHRQCLFGHIPPLSAEIILSPLGEIVQEEWHKSFVIRTELFCDAFIIMPNHLHAIVRIEPSVDTHGNASNNQTDDNTSNFQTDGRSFLQNNRLPQQNDDMPHFQTDDRPSLPKNSGVAYRPPRSISSFVAGFKSAATKRINGYRNLPETPVWQSRFHDHIIRDAAQYQRIKTYIENNPNNWTTDKFYNDALPS